MSGEAALEPAFSLQNTLQRSAPLILTALAVAIPARIGLIMIGGEGALVLGGFAAAVLAIPMIGHVPPMLTLIIIAIFAMIVGGFWVGLAGFLRYARGVNETISSLLLTYIGIAIMNFFVEGALRDLSDPNKPSTKPLGKDYMVGIIPGTEVHWEIVFGLALCVALYFLLERTTFGFAARVTGGNFRARSRKDCRSGGSSSPARRSPGPAPGLPVSSKWRQFRAAPTLRSPPATALLAFSSRSWRGTTRSSSPRWRSCLAALSPPAASSSGAWVCPTRRCRFSRA